MKSFGTIGHLHMIRIYLIMFFLLVLVDWLDLKNQLHIELLITLIRERIEQPMYIPGAFRIQCQIKTTKLGMEIANQVEIEQTDTATIAFIFSKEDKSNILLHPYNSNIEHVRVDRRLKGNQHQFSEINQANAIRHCCQNQIIDVLVLRFIIRQIIMTENELLSTLVDMQV